MNWLERMIQFKEKATKQGNTNYHKLMKFHNIKNNRENGLLIIY